MRKNKKHLLPLLGLLSLSSCATLSDLGTISGGAALDQANFSYIGSVNGSSSSVLLLGFIGGSNAAQKAVDQLRKKANLQDNQALTNIAVSKAVSYGIFTTTTTFNVSADIVEFK